MVKVPGGEIYGRAQSALAASPIFELRDLVVLQEEPDSLVISGTVSSFYHKQMAQEVVRIVCEKAHVEVVNSIHVRQTSPRRDSLLEDARTRGVER